MFPNIPQGSWVGGDGTGIFIAWVFLGGANLLFAETNAELVLHGLLTGKAIANTETAPIISRMIGIFPFCYEKEIHSRNYNDYRLRIKKGKYNNYNTISKCSK